MDQVADGGRRPAVRGQPDQRAQPPDPGRGSSPGRARGGLSPLPGGAAEPADLPDAPGVVAGPRSRDGRRATSQAFVKLGSDNDNFYLYPGARPDRPPGSPRRSSTSRPGGGCGRTWRTAGSAGEPPSGAAECGTENTGATSPAKVPISSTSPIPGSIHPIWPRCRSLRRHLPGRPAVTIREVELWVDDIRLSDPVSQTGTAMSVDARLAASDVGNFSAAYTRQNGQFRQINQDPTYRGHRRAADDGQPPAGSVPAHLVRAGGAAHGELRPHSNVNPELLTGTDLRGEALTGLRQAGVVERHLRPDAPTEPSGHQLGHQRPARPAGLHRRPHPGRAQTELSDASSSTYALGLNYQLSCVGTASGCRSAGSRASCRVTPESRSVARTSAWCRRGSASPAASTGTRPTRRRSSVRWRAATTGCSRRRSRSTTCGATRPD